MASIAQANYAQEKDTSKSRCVGLVRLPCAHVISGSRRDMRVEPPWIYWFIQPAWAPNRIDLLSDADGIVMPLNRHE